ncbi:MAG: DNA primase, partial [Candidatus Thiodiazotropha sp. (ex Lucinoma kastoroae)]|nr:DNA primase [Candidatus Thiodiazotropha sp. (ex Lucinoma kastoroae)]
YALQGCSSAARGQESEAAACQVKPANKSLGVVIRSAVWLGKGEAPSKLEHQQVNEAQESFEPLPAKVIPEPPKPDIPAEVKEDEVVIILGDRRYRIRGLAKNLSANQLKVNLLVNREAALHVDTFDLYAAKARGHYIKQAAIELGLKEAIIKADLGKVLLKCEALQEAQIRQTLEPKAQAIKLADSDRKQALALLKSPDLMPEEERVQYSAMTGQSLFYMGETNLKHKIPAIAEEEGAENASYALKLLQSEGVLTIASTGKDETSGTMVTKEYRVEGPVMLFLTTTAIDIDEELMNRCLVLTVNESREQTQAIHVMQRQQQTLEGLLQNEDRKQLIQLHHNACYVRF